MDLPACHSVRLSVNGELFSLTTYYLIACKLLSENTNNKKNSLQTSESLQASQSLQTSESLRMMENFGVQVLRGFRWLGEV